MTVGLKLLKAYGWTFSSTVRANDALKNINVSHISWLVDLLRSYVMRACGILFTVFIICSQKHAEK